MGYVYKITNTVNGKAYIGISIHEPETGRIKDHLSGQGNRLIANAVKKYGTDAFTYEILEANVFDEFLPDLEVAYIANYNTIAPHGYNLNSGGDHAIPSAETRRRLSRFKGENHHFFGKTLSEEHRRNISEGQKGKTVSKETRRKISEANKGKKRTPEARRKISEAQKGEKHHNFGKKLPEEYRRKISEANKGKTHTQETCRKISEAHKGKKKSEAHRRKLSEAHKNSPLAIEARRKLSEAQKGENHPLYGKKHSQETLRKMSEAQSGKKNGFFGKKHTEQTRRKMSEAAKKHPDHNRVRKFFFSLPPDMQLTEKRKLLFKKFPNVKKGTIYDWVNKWKLSD